LTASRPSPIIFIWLNDVEAKLVIPLGVLVRPFPLTALFDRLTFMASNSFN